ncbi:MAG: hypothetical protein NZ108_11215, partial [Bacteroidia bacterium]|nr:hypothetical protein [Bacteroidia bacterium]
MKASLLFVLLVIVNGLFAQTIQTSYLDDWVNNQWVVKSRYDYTYNGNLISSVIQQDARPGNNWQNVYRTTYSYTSFQQFQSIFYEQWDSTNQVWKNLSKIDYTYLPNQKLSQRTIFSWQGNQWTPSSKTDYSYDAADSLIIESDNYWNA